MQYEYFRVSLANVNRILSLSISLIEARFYAWNGKCECESEGEKLMAASSVFPCIYRSRAFETFNVCMDFIPFKTQFPLASQPHRP